MNFERMQKEPDRFHVYVGCYADLILGSGLAMSYVQCGDKMRVESYYLESATINLLELSSLMIGLLSVPQGEPFRVHTNNRYIETVLMNSPTWRNHQVLDQKAYGPLVEGVVNRMDELGQGQVHLTIRKNQRDDVMNHVIKYGKHLYHSVQMKMIDKMTTNLPSNLFPVEQWTLEEMPGSIIWKVPFSVSEFEKKMHARRKETGGHLKLVQPLGEKK